MNNKKQKLILFIIILILAFFGFAKSASAAYYTSGNWTSTKLTVHSHPQKGDDWVVSFETTGTADLTITPEDQATIDDLDFVSLKCSGSTSDGGAPSGDDSSEVENYVQPQILANDV